MSNSTLSVIIPVYNEAPTLAELLGKVCGVVLTDQVQKEIIIVNDGSTDNTEEQVQEFIRKHPEHTIKYLRHDRNLGKGAAIQTGIPECSGDYVVIQDADLEYNPEEYNGLLQPIIEGSADVVYGSRFVGGNPHRVLFFWHYLGNKVLTLLSNAFSNLNLTDMETCYKMFSSRIIKSIHLEETGFGFEPEVTLKLAKIPEIRVYEIGISYYGRNYQEGKKIGWRDGLEAIKCIWKYNSLGDWVRGKEQILLRSLGTPLVILFFLAGALFRLRQYAINRSLWLDEAFLSLNVMNRSFQELLEPLDWSQVAPIGFLYLQKLLVLTFGNNEMTLRALPVVSGLLSMILIFKLTQLLLDKHTAFIALGLFSVSYWMIYYSSEVKQYSSDVLFSLLTFYLFFRYVWDSPKFRHYFLFGIYGALVIWVSNAVMLVLASLIIFAGLQALFHRHNASPKGSLVALGFIMAGGLSYYLLFIKDHPTAEIMRVYWRDHFLPIDSWTSAREWLLIRWHGLFRDVLDFQYRGKTVKLFFLAGLVGSIFLRTRAWVLVLPMLIHWVASGFKLYPVDTRLILYASTGIIILIAYGIQLPGRVLYSKVLLGLILALYLMFPGLVTSWENFKQPTYGEHIRPVLESIAHTQEPEDLVYVYCASVPAYLFYEKMLFTNGVRTVYGEKLDNPEAFERQLRELSGRTWFVFSHPSPAEGIEHIEQYMELLKVPTLKEFSSPGARAFLVQLP